MKSEIIAAVAFHTQQALGGPVIQSILISIDRSITKLVASDERRP
jgi:hypothetical protein